MMRLITSESMAGRAFSCEHIPASDDGRFRLGRNGSPFLSRVVAGASILPMTSRRAARLAGERTSVSNQAFNGRHGRVSQWLVWRRGFTVDRYPLANFSSVVSASWAHN